MVVVEHCAAVRDRLEAADRIFDRVTAVLAVPDQDWPYVLVEAGPSEALRWRTGHTRGGMRGSLPDLFSPSDRSWLVSGLWDDTWCCIGAPDALIDALTREPLANAWRVHPHEDMLPPGLRRE